jgi:hypothetical protein
MIDATRTHFLECKEYQPGPDGHGVSRYLLRLIPKNGDRIITIRLKPGEILSHRKFKVALMNHCIVYDYSKVEHDANLRLILESRLIPMH